MVAINTGSLSDSATPRKAWHFHFQNLKRDASCLSQIEHFPVSVVWSILTIGVATILPRYEAVMAGNEPIVVFAYHIN